MSTVITSTEAVASATGGGGDNAAAASQHTADNIKQSTISSSNAKDDDDEERTTTSNIKSRRPANVALTQQRMKAWQPLLDPKWIIAAYLAIGIIFIPTGIVIRNKSDNLTEIKAVYESYDPKIPVTPGLQSCEIGNNANAMYLNNQQTCQITLKIPDDAPTLQPPILLHYELSNFYQNQRRYFNSYDQNQLYGSLTQISVDADTCQPLNIIGGIKINPCGLIANTLFNDVITLDSIVDRDGNDVTDTTNNNAVYPLVETGIAWESDLQYKFNQPEGFKYEQCPSCDECECTQPDWSCTTPYKDEDGVCFRYFYPDDDTTQYLYETYPMMISPLEGVLNEHFVVWMRTAALPHFRKLYGYIEQPIEGGSTLTFNVQANFVVERLQGSKALVLSNNYIFGGKNHWLGTLFIVVGGIAAILGALFLAKDYLSPRKLGDKMYLKVPGEKED